MSTLTIELEDELALRLAKVSAERHMKPSDVVSESLSRTLPAGTTDSSPSALAALQDIVGCFDSGEKDLATHPRHLEGLGQWRQ